MIDCPFITSDLPGLGGSLKLTPAHFKVEEIPLYLPEGSGQHIYITIERSGKTTREVVDILRNAFNLKDQDIGYAGLKDKEAQTIQTFSLDVKDEPKAAVLKINELGLGLKALTGRRHANKLKVGHLLGNRFTVHLTGLKMPLAEAGLKAGAIAEKIKETGLPNYFGAQRFGPEKQNVAKALSLITGSSGRKNDWRSKFLKSALQSEIYNIYLSMRVEAGYFQQIITGDICKKTATGGLFQTEDPQVETARLLSGELSSTGPIFGRKMSQAALLAGLLEEKALEKSGLTPQQVGSLGDGTRRANRILITDLGLTPSVDNEALIFSFSLPKGSYATVLLREFMKLNDGFYDARK